MACGQNGVLTAGAARGPFATTHARGFSNARVQKNVSGNGKQAILTKL
jgi:hypothetical protein